ncbi:MAG: alpha/beta hydrolase [Chloroflexales bacterium]|nr:alpha/beta hydrolase [Chloroflexales bacterium]
MTAEELSLGGARINLYRLTGQPDHIGDLPILLVHGIADSALTWSSMMAPLRHLGPVYAVDLPGFGLSSCPSRSRYTAFGDLLGIVQELIEEVIKRPVLLIGNSLGGWLAARLALTAPMLLRGVVLLNPGGALLGGRDSWQGFVDTIGVGDLRTVRKIYRQMFGRIHPELYLVQRGFQSLFVRDSVQQFVASTSEADFLDVEELRQISVPVALVWGMRDYFLPEGSFEFFLDYLPNPTVLLLPGSGHLPQRENPVEVALFVSSFVRRMRFAAGAENAGVSLSSSLIPSYVDH